MGPTGSGKSDLAVQLAEKLPLEIISVDSALVYRGMDIGTAKPSLSTRARIPHHLIDTRDPKMGYSVGEFLLEAQRGNAGHLVAGTPTPAGGRDHDVLPCVDDRDRRSARGGLRGARAH